MSIATVKELNRYPVSYKNLKLRVALVYPNIYRAGMSSYAIHLLYSMFNSYEGVICERFFLREKIKYPLYKESAKIPGFNKDALRSVETNTPLHKFDVIAITLQYELDYKNILWIIDSIGIPFLGSERALDENQNYPLLIGGGPCVRSNPLTMLPFFDMMIINDLEPIMDNLMKFLLKNSEKISKFNFLMLDSNSELSRQARSLKNILISPLALRFLEEIRSNQLQNIDNETDNEINNEIESEIKENNQSKRQVYQNYPIEKQYLKKFSLEFTPIHQIIPEFSDPNKGLVFGQTYLLELNRGCPYGCNFCLTGYLNRPFRNRDFDEIITLIDEGLSQNPVNKVTFIGSAIADHPKFIEIAKYVLEKESRLMIPSIRTNKLTPELLKILKQSGLKSITIAPETGSERLRKILNKHMSDELIVEKCCEIFKEGFESIKFYFLIGLPFEEQEDIDAISQLIIKIIDSVGIPLPRNSLRLSINFMIPKLFTPFGCYTHNFLSRNLKYFKEKQKQIEVALKKYPQVSIDFMDVKQANMQTLFSQMDETFAEYILKFYNMGAQPVSIKKLERLYDQKGQDLLIDSDIDFENSIEPELIKSFRCQKMRCRNNQMKKILKLVDFGYNDPFFES